MESNEIKEQYKMLDVIQMYGLNPDRSGFIRCPFHSGDRTASLKVYKDSFHCYGCHANGDIFKFVQLMDECDFKTAYFKLGGSYKAKKSFSDLRKLHKAKVHKAEYKRHIYEAIQSLKYTNELIDTMQFNLEYLKEGSKEWHRSLLQLEQCYEEHEKLLKEIKNNGYI